MAYEILNNSRVTPMRLHALARLVSRFPSQDRESISRLLQPPGLEADEQLINELVRAARSIQLVDEDAQTKAITLQVSADAVQTVDVFRVTLQRLTLGANTDDQPNFLLSLFTAWYAAQDGEVLAWTPKEYEEKFSEQLFGSASTDTRPFNTTKYNGWRMWAEFLGWGWMMSMGSSEVFVPDAYQRVAGVLSQSLPPNGGSIEFRAFIEHLARYCPELDGGVLYRQAWQASHGGILRGNQVSLMLSNALRGLHDAGAITLLRNLDSPDMWALYPATGHSIVSNVTHLKRGKD